MNDLANTSLSGERKLYGMFMFFEVFQIKLKLLRVVTLSSVPKLPISDAWIISEINHLYQILPQGLLRKPNYVIALKHII
jgi:hypothetical protein